VRHGEVSVGWQMAEGGVGLELSACR